MHDLAAKAHVPHTGSADSLNRVRPSSESDRSPRARAWAGLPRGDRPLALEVHDLVRDRDVEVLAEALDDAGLEPVGLAAREREDDDLVGARQAQLVLDRAERAARVAD